MRIRLLLRYGREPELVALRYNPCLDFAGIVKQALKACADKKDFRFVLPNDSFYVKKPLSIWIRLDEEKDAEIINMLNDVMAPNTVFIRNLLIRSLDGDIGAIYRDMNLKRMAVAGRDEKNG